MYGSVEAGRARREPPRRRRLLVAGSFLGFVAAAVLLAVPAARRSASVLEQWRIDMPWKQYEFQPLDTFPVPLDEDVYQDSTPGYDKDNCLENPFQDLPPGYLCTSIKFGVYLLDPYGSLYNRRIQWKTREMVRHMSAEDEQKIADGKFGDEDVDGAAMPSGPHSSEERETANEEKPKEENVIPAAPKRSWSAPWMWMRTSLLPNITVCEEAVEGFYDAISSPNKENMTDAKSFLSNDFVYQGPKSPLLPACIAAVGGGKQTVGPDAWAEKFTESTLAFGASNSTLGGIMCKPVNTRRPLEPMMKCVAKHLCVFELLHLKDKDGENVTLAGEILDTFYFNREGEIAWLRSDTQASDFKVQHHSEAGPSQDGSAAEPPEHEPAAE